MPARPIVAAILLFWLAMAGWYVAREVAPRWGREDNPSFHIDLTDEVGAPAVDWQALVNGKRIGRATTQVRRLGDDLFEMKGDFAASEMRLLDVDLRTIRIQTRYQVNTEGRLLDTALSLRVNLSGLDLHLGVKGKVENGTWTPVFEIDGQPIPDLPFLQSVKLGSGGNVMNTMMPHRRIPGLRLGQKWRVPLLDPVGDLKSWLGKNTVIEELEALVVADNLDWNGEEVDCFKIEYREPGKAEPSAHTWVRRRDGVVLKQEAQHAGITLTLLRDPPRF
ncbi:MAG: hypothetical protein U0793_19950 [Gemmataceae bacterium]